MSLEWTGSIPSKHELRQIVVIFKLLMWQLFTFIYNSIIQRVKVPERCIQVLWPVQLNFWYLKVGDLEKHCYINLVMVEKCIPNCHLCLFSLY